MDNRSRLERRIQRDFPEPGSANGVIHLLDELPDGAGYDREILSSERVRAAIVILAKGKLADLRAAIELAKTDWRDLLVTAELANADWPARLDEVLGS
jgi:hypothetical protein